MTDLVERLVSEELCALFRRVVPPAVVIRMGKSKRVPAAVAVATGVLAVAGWLGFRWMEEPLAEHAVRRYDATVRASTAPHTQYVFTGRVQAFEEQRETEGWTQDVYRVDVATVLRGSVHGTVRVTYGLDEGVTPRLKDGSTYVFATNAWADPDKDGHAHLYEGARRPVNDEELSVWRRAAALPLAGQQRRRGDGGTSPAEVPPFTCRRPGGGQLIRRITAINSARVACLGRERTDGAEVRMKSPGRRAPRTVMQECSGSNAGHVAGP